MDELWYGFMTSDMDWWALIWIYDLWYGFMTSDMDWWPLIWTVDLWYILLNTDVAWWHMAGWLFKASVLLYARNSLFTLIPQVCTLWPRRPGPRPTDVRCGYPLLARLGLIELPDRPQALTQVYSNVNTCLSDEIDFGFVSWGFSQT